METVLSDKAETHLYILTEIADILQLDHLNFSNFASSVTRLSDAGFELKRSLYRLQYAEQELENAFASAKYQEQLISTWLDELGQGENLLDLELRKALLLNRKAKEYETDLKAALADQEPTPLTVTDILEQRERLRLKHIEVKIKRAKIKAFQGLPPNIDVARVELQAAKREQTGLIQLRERLLGKIAEGII